MKNIFVYISFLIMLAACNQSNDAMQSREGDIVLASVKGKNFYFTDVSKEVFSNISEEDSLVVLNQIVDSWIDEELFLLKSKETITNLNEIEFEVENYKRSLINASYEKQLLNSFDINLTEEEIQSYYDRHQEFFVFEEVYFEVNYLLIPRNTKNLAKIKKAISEGTENHWVDNFCVNNPENCFIESSTHKTKKFLKETFKIPSQDLYKMNSYKYQYLNSEWVAIYKINKKYAVGETAPIEIVKKEVTKLALHEKKQNYLLEIKEKTIQKAKNDKIFEKYIN